MSLSSSRGGEMRGSWSSRIHGADRSIFTKLLFGRPTVRLDKNKYEIIFVITRSSNLDF
jgi:hypothetical protein